MDDSVLDLPAHLRHRVPPARPEGRPGEKADDVGLPSLAEGEYRPFGRPSNKPLYTLHFIAPAGEVRSFQYHHLDSDSRYVAGTITIRFVGAPSFGLPAIQVTIEGRNLWELYDYIHQHRTSFVMAAARDFGKDGQVIVTRITFTAIAEPEGVSSDETD